MSPEYFAEQISIRIGWHSIETYAMKIFFQRLYVDVCRSYFICYLSLHPKFTVYFKNICSITRCNSCCGVTLIWYIEKQVFLIFWNIFFYSLWSQEMYPSFMLLSATTHKLWNVFLDIKLVPWKERYCSVTINCNKNNND